MNDVFASFADAIEQFRGIAFNHFGESKQPPGAEAVDALSRFPNLLECDARSLAESLAERRLAGLGLTAPRPHALADRRVA